MSEASLNEKVSEWLSKTGLPLELAAAASFRKVKFDVTHSAVYADPEMEKGREIDVVAYARDGTGLLQFYAVVECKASPNPWVVLATEEKVHLNFAALGLATDNTREALPDRAFFRPDALADALLSITSTGYALRQAFCRDNDPAYAASMSLAKAAKVQLLESLSRTERYKFVLPVLVVDAPLYECTFQPDGTMKPRQVQLTSFQFTAYIPDRVTCVIRVVHKESMDYLARQLRRVSDEIFANLKYKVDEWVASLKK